MGFKCNCCNEVVKNESCVLVPAKMRKVRYNGFKRIPARGAIKEDKYVFEKSTEGWEAINELKIAKSHLDKFMASGFQTEKIDSNKEVDYVIKMQKKRIVASRDDQNDDKGGYAETESRRDNGENN